MKIGFQKNGGASVGRVLLDGTPVAEFHQIVTGNGFSGRRTVYHFAPNAYGKELGLAFIGAINSYADMKIQARAAIAKAKGESTMYRAPDSGRVEG